MSHLSEPCDPTNVQVVTRSGLPTDVAVRPANTEQNIVSQSSGADFEGVTVSDVVAGDESGGVLSADYTGSEAKGPNLAAAESVIKEKNQTHPCITAGRCQNVAKAIFTFMLEF